MRLLLTTLAAMTTVATAVHAAPQVQGAWSRPAAAGTTGAGFMTLANPGKTPDALVSASSPIAREVQIHQSSMANGVAAMRRLDRVPLAAGERVTFKPGGYHLMLMGLKRPLAVGDKAPVTLVFASGAKVEATFVVGLAPPVDPHAHH